MVRLAGNKRTRPPAHSASRSRAPTRPPTVERVPSPASPDSSDNCSSSTTTTTVGERPSLAASTNRIQTPPNPPSDVVVSINSTSSAPRSRNGSSAVRLQTTPRVPQSSHSTGRNLLSQIEQQLQPLVENGPSTTDQAEIVQQVKEFMAQQTAFNERLIKSIEEGAKKACKERKTKLPLALTACVRDVVKSITDNDGNPLSWDLSKGFTAVENQNINHLIMTGVKSVNDTPSSIIRAAMHGHFKTRKRALKIKEQNMDKERLQNQRARSRINTKKRLRKNALENSTSIVDKEKYSEVMSNDYMSSEYSVSEDEISGNELELSSGQEDEHEGHTKTRKFAVQKLSWRSDELNKLMVTLDKKVERKRGRKGIRMAFERTQGNMSKRLAPIDAPAWAIR